MRMRGSAKWLVLTLAACSGSERAPVSTRPASSTATVARPALASTRSDAPARSSSATPASKPELAAPEATRVVFERVLDERATALAVGRSDKVAVLACAGPPPGCVVEPAMLDGGWARLPMPDAHRALPGEELDVGIYFGRDDRPRVMGARLRGQTSSAVYLRYKNGWRAEPSEIGKLASDPPAGLYGVLGHDDPEVVCKPSVLCIVKRRSGWTMFTPSAQRPRWVVFSRGHVLALHADRIERLADDGWMPVGHPPPFRNPEGAWLMDEEEEVAGFAEKPHRGFFSALLWVTVPSDDAIYRFDGSAWARQPSPIVGPRAVWASSARDMWLVGDGGAAHHDGSRWRVAKSIAGPLSVVVGNSAGEVWMAGGSGVWRGRPAH